MKLRTVVIERDGMAVRINESKFDPKKHKLYTPKAEPKPKKASTDGPTMTHKGGGRWIVEREGNQIHEGYLKKAEAEALVAKG